MAVLILKENGIKINEKRDSFANICKLFQSSENETTLIKKVFGGDDFNKELFFFDTFGKQRPLVFRGNYTEKRINQILKDYIFILTFSRDNPRLLIRNLYQRVRFCSRETYNKKILVEIKNHIDMLKNTPQEENNYYNLILKLNEEYDKYIEEIKQERLQREAEEQERFMRFKKEYEKTQGSPKEQEKVELFDEPKKINNNVSYNIKSEEYDDDYDEEDYYDEINRDLEPYYDDSFDNPHTFLYDFFRSDSFERMNPINANVLCEDEEERKCLEKILDKCSVSYEYRFTSAYDNDLIIACGNNVKAMIKELSKFQKNMLIINTSYTNINMKDDVITVINGFDEEKIVEQIKKYYINGFKKDKIND